jgi:hypothetical protein
MFFVNLFQYGQQGNNFAFMLTVAIGEPDINEDWIVTKLENLSEEALNKGLQDLYHFIRANPGIMETLPLGSLQRRDRFVLKRVGATPPMLEQL